MKNTIKEKTIDEFNTVNPLLDSMYQEIKAFALKKQDGSLSKLKVLAINQVLERAKTFLDDEPFSEFIQILDLETLPSNSDAVMIIANYKTAMNSFYQKYTVSLSFGSRIWNRDKDESTSEDTDQDEVDLENQHKADEDDEDESDDMD